MALFQLAPRSAAKLKQMRKEGLIPVGLVERDHQTVPLQISKQKFKEATHRGSHAQVDIRVDGEKDSRKAILQKIDLDPLSQEIISITLKAVSQDDFVKMDVPVVGVGENEDAKAGGVTLTLVTDHLKLRGKVSDMPDTLQVDISGIPAGGTIHANEVPLPDGIELLTTADVIVFSNTIDKEPELPEPEATEETGEVPEDSETTESTPEE